MSLLSSIVPAFNRSVARNGTGAASATGPVVKPAYDVRETPEAFGLTVQLPGVAKDGLEITAAEGELTIVGRRGWKRPEGWTQLYRESSDATFELVLSHDNALDLDRIQAELKDGVLRLALPKAEAIKPRKIAIS